MFERFRRPSTRRVRDRRLPGVVTPIDLPRKEDASCCVARVDEHGRLPIGFCSPSCERRRTRDLLNGVS